jgi:molybdate transport system regulatory protein
MVRARVSIRIDLANGVRIGIRNIALLEAIRAQGSISAAARYLSRSRQSVWLDVEEINQALREPAVITETGGRQGGGAVVTPVGMKLIALYRRIEARAQAAVATELGAVGALTETKRAAV